MKNTRLLKHYREASEMEVDSMLRMSKHMTTFWIIVVATLWDLLFAVFGGNIYCFDFALCMSVFLCKSVHDIRWWKTHLEKVRQLKADIVLKLDVESARS